VGFLFVYQLVSNKLQDKHNASYFFNMSWTDYAYPTANLTIFSQCLAIQNFKFVVVLRKRIE